MAEKPQFDEFLGGTQSLPHDVPIMNLAAARAGEIAAMTYSIDNPQQTRLIFQKLPVHMRRRVMSHNAKRLPRKLREAHIRQMAKSGLPPKSKRPSRRYRRRPRNLLQEYNRRQRGKVWLETHIWHAKRFHMVEKWGYRIASHANDKCFKANYRAVTRHCLMQDLSYYSCIEIRGEEGVLKETLEAHCNPTELTFGAKCYAAGSREGGLMFFAKNGYPRSPIGNVHFLWKPGGSEERTIWIWVHPMFYASVLEEIISSFGFTLRTAEVNASTSAGKSMEPKRYDNDTGCQMVLLKDALNRFRLYGPLTLATLTDALRLPDASLTDGKSTLADSFGGNEGLIVTGDGKSSQMEGTERGNIPTENDSSIEKPWYIDYYNIRQNAEAFKVQKEVWQVLKTLDSPNQLPPRIVLGFTVLDPRFYIPERRTRPTKESRVSERMPMPPTNANCTPIWDSEIRTKVTKSFPPSSKINKIRSTFLVPGIDNDKYFDENSMAKIPILLIQRPGGSGTGLGSGIDVILPAGWSMPFWLAIVFRCTRIGALRESRSIAFESLNTRSPDINDPDTAAYKKEALGTKTELTEKYFRYPPNRRVNFIKFGISSPFFCEWQMLMREWSSTETFYVLRNREQLSLLQSTISSPNSKRRKHSNEIRPPTVDIPSIFPTKNCLVRVKVSVLRKGCPKRFAVICVPTVEDLEKFRGNNTWSGPVEKFNHDPNEKQRRVLRKNHLAFLRRARRNRVRRKKAFQDKIGEVITTGVDGTNKIRRTKDALENLLDKNRAIVLEQSRKMSKLYLPDCSRVRHSCDREVMGYVTLGDFSLTEAKGVGVGFVTLQSLLETCDKKSELVLIRNTQTRQYRFARIEIIS